MAESKGVGDWISWQLEKLMIYPLQTCKCTERKEILNRWGPDLCEKHKATIELWLQEAANNRGLPFIRVVARKIIDNAIKWARSTDEPI
jgi:hypothetical protein